MLKRVDVAVYNAFTDAKDGKFTAWHPGARPEAKMASAGRWTTTTSRSITPEMKAAVDKAKADIISGAVKVHDYTADNACPKS